jgi:protocatechuate 3,4-dioxygenase beta subunit
MNRFILAVLVSALFLSGRQAAAQEQGAAAHISDVAGVPQSPQTYAEDTRQGGRAASITGRVLTSEGNLAIANARVLARAAGAGGVSSLRMATTDDEGNFQLTNLRPGNYLIRVAAPGYISEPTAVETPATLYRPGEPVTLRMVRGGVITGRVLNTNGEPLALARVRAVRVKDAEGRPVRDSGAGRVWMTDDRGIYRLYGLEPGAYVVAAGSSGMFRPAPGQSRSAGEQGGEAALTYYPSSSLDAATHVSVYGGEETRGIDIRNRVERSYSVRGTVAARNVPASRAFISITLSHAASGLALDFANIIPTGSNTLFNFDGVPDGVYELTALTAPGTSAAAVALPQRVSVHGASVSDVVLTLTPFGSVTGRVLLETAGTTEAIEACRDARTASIEETLISARRDEADATKQLPSVASLLPIEAQPDARGEFALTNMSAGRYSLDVRPPGRLWYVRDIASASAAKTTTSSTPVNLPSSGLTLKLGERVQGLTVRLAPGAASIAGRVSPAAGAALPARLRVYAVPVEREHIDDVLRYAGTQVQLDGAFAIEHLAPGRYWLFARASADADTANENAGRAVILDAKMRAALRRDAGSANLAVELQPCQQGRGYALPFKP